MLRPSGIAALVALAITGGCAREHEAASPARAAQRRDIFLRPQAHVVEAVIPPRATLDSLLRAYDFPSALVQSAVRSAGSVFNLRQLRENQPYRLVRTIDGLLQEFEYQIDTDRFLRIFT